MVAVPIAHDQFGVAARTEWSGTGLRLDARECDPARLRTAIKTVLGDPSFRLAAQRFQRLIARNDGLVRAGDIIEQVLATG